MERFTLLFRLEQQLVSNDELKAIIKEHLATHDCTACDTKDVCPIKNCEINIKSYIVSESDSYEKIKAAIAGIIGEPSIIFMVLIDGQKDMLYIYKSKGTIQHIKKNVLPPIVKMYNTIHRQEDSFFTIEDVRMLKWFNPSLN